MRTGLAGMPGLMTQVARGMVAVTDAASAFDKWNTLGDRIARLPAEGIVFGAFLFGVGGMLDTSLVEDGSVLQDVVPDWTTLREGRAACARECLVIEHHGRILLPADALMTAEQLFPDWIQRSTPVMYGLGLGIIGNADKHTLTLKELML